MSPRKARARRPRRLASAATPCPSKTRTPKVTPKCPAAAPLRQPTCRVASPNAAAAAASVSPAAAHPDSRSIVSAGPGSGDTEVSPSNAPHRPHGGSYRVAQATGVAAPSPPSRRRRAWLAGAGPGGAGWGGAGPPPLPRARRRGLRRYRPTCAGESRGLRRAQSGRETHHTGSQLVKPELRSSRKLRWRRGL